jgi:hypothetical protein
MTIETDSFVWNDYEAIAVRNKWVLILRGVGYPGRQGLFQIGAGDRIKPCWPGDNGAGDPLCRVPDLTEILIDQDFFQQAGLGSLLQVSRALADEMLQQYGYSVHRLEIQSAEKTSVAFDLPVTLRARTDIEEVMGRTHNYVGIIEGSDRC